MSQTITLTFSVTVELPDGATIAVATPAVATATEPAAQLVVVPEPALPRAPGQRLGRAQRAILDALADRHGRVADPSGRATGKFIESTDLPNGPWTRTSLSKLDDFGLIERQIRGKRCYRITLTPAGWSAIDRTPPHRAAHHRHHQGSPCSTLGTPHAC